MESARLLCKQITSQCLSDNEKIDLIKKSKMSLKSFKKILKLNLDPHNLLLIMKAMDSREAYGCFMCGPDCCGGERDLAFSILLMDPIEIYKVAHKKKLLPHELEIVYNTYHEFYFHKWHNNFHKYYDYCQTFNKFLSNIEKEFLVQRLTEREFWHMIVISLRDFKLKKEQKDKLISCLIISKLSILAFLSFAYDSFSDLF